MNDDANLLTRLLKLFPVKFIKQHFNIDDNYQPEIIRSIIQNNTPQVIKRFSLNSINNTKQHIYLFTLSSRFNRNTFNSEIFPLDIIHEVASANNYEFQCLPIVNYEVVVLNPFDEITIQYYQPTVINFNNKQLIVKCTILEKSLSYLFNTNRKIVDVNKNNDEDINIGGLLHYLADSYNPISTDINAGLKHLWDTNIVDSKNAKWKKARSFATEAMDEGYTLKTQYPEVYQTLINAPLNKTIFKYLKDDNLFCNHFTADAGKGQLSVPLFPDNEQQINNILHEILSHN
jgi:hypothetical protein